MSDSDRRLIIVLDIAQAEQVAACAPTCPMVSFAPDATRYLRQRGFDVTPSCWTLNWVGHARAVVRLDRALEPVLDRLSAQLHLTAVERAAFSFYLYQLFATHNVVERVLRPYRRHVERFGWWNGREIAESADLEQAIYCLVAALSPFPRLVERDDRRQYSSLHGRFAGWLNRALAWHLRGRRTIAFLDHGNPLAQHLARQLMAVDPDLVMLQCRAPASTMLGSLRRVARGLLRRSAGAPSRPYVALLATERPVPDAPTVSIKGPIPMLPPTLRRLIEHLAARLLPPIRRQAWAGQRHVEIFRPAVVLGDHMFFAPRLQAAATQAAAGKTVMMVTHGSHSLPPGAISRRAAIQWARQGRIVTRDVDRLVVKTPGALELARVLECPLPARIYRLPVYARAPRHRAAGRRFTVVLAGNYQDAMRTVPWQMETADEYQETIRATVAAVAALPDISLVIKVKPTKYEGLSLADIQDAVDATGNAANVSIETDMPMAALLGKTDLVICNLSSVADEALFNRIPVLLFSATGRYFHFPPRFQPPTPTERAAVYGCRHRDELPAMLNAIRRSHQGVPLSAGEIAGWAWRDTEFDHDAELLSDA